MKTLKGILSKGPDDFGAWFENIEGVYGAGATVAEAKKNLMDGERSVQKSVKRSENMACSSPYCIDPLLLTLTITLSILVMKGGIITPLFYIKGEQNEANHGKENKPSE